MKNAARCLSDIRATTRETTKRLITILLLPGDLEGKTVSLSVVSLKKISGFFVNKIPVSCSMYDVTVLEVGATSITFYFGNFDLSGD